MMHIDRATIADGCTDASDLGLRAGQWPTTIPVAPDVICGNGQPFMRVRDITHYGEFAGCVYRQANGTITVNVYND